SNACWFGTWNTTETSLAGARHSSPSSLTVRSLRPCVGTMPARVPFGRVKVSSIEGSSFPVRCVMPQVMAIHVPGRLQTSRSRLTRRNYKWLELARGFAFAWKGMRCRRSRADISADAGISASGAAWDAELPHRGLERGPFHAETGGCTGGTADGTSTRHEKI